MAARIVRKVEMRSALGSSPAGFTGAFGGGATNAGSYVSPRLAENLSTVLACIGAIGSVMASLPVYVYRAAAQGREELRDHPVARLVRKPNAWQTWPDLIEWVMAQALLHGNAVCVIEPDGAGRPTALLPIPWSNVLVSLLPSGRMAYDVTHYIALWGGTGQPRRYLSDEVLHLKDRSDDGLIGRSRLSRAPEVLGTASALQE